jgi:GxxExxY protein
MPIKDLIEKKRTESIIGAFYEVYNTMGFGFLEHIYANSLERELIRRGHSVDREISVHVMYKGEYVGTHRLDLLVDNKVILELKATAQLHASAKPQLHSYLRATNLEVGLLLHFGPEAKFYRQISTNHENFKNVVISRIR